MKLSVPFIPDEKYTHFLKNKTPFIESVYFALYSGPVLDSRMRFKTAGIKELVRLLNSLSITHKYCLLNSRFIQPDLYDDPNFLNHIADNLEYLVEKASISGIVFSDFYLLNALSRTKRKCLSSLEAVPGVNMMIDTVQKAVSLFDHIDQSRFKPPGKLVLDRSLNRQIKGLASVSKKIRLTYPKVKIELLANEGCIYHCPFKLTHDAHISFSNTRLVKNTTNQINRELGCAAYFYKQPEKFFISPFIRPEDVAEYVSFADTIKLCGRTLGTTFLKQCIIAFIEESFEGNLFKLMDASNWMSSILFLDNKKLDPGFFKMITTCTKSCKACILCSNLSLKTIKRLSVQFKQYKDYL